MTAHRPIPQHIRARQSQASDPSRSAWVSANAGSGKTFVLARRVIRLLLERTPPSKLLCLTFTKAAAANMSARVFDILAKWTRLDDDALLAELETTTGARPRAEDLNYARQLFARTVETPGGLKIQTIHAFCERLLHVFPFEANVAARFEVVQDLRQAEMLQAARDAVLTAAMSGRQHALHRAVQVLEEEAGSAGFDTILRECLGKRRLLRSLDLTRHAEDLRSGLGLRPGDDDDGAIDMAVVRDGISPDRWLGIAKAIGADGGTGARLVAAAALHIDDPAKCDAYMAVFLKADFAPRAASYVAKKVRTALPDLCAQLDAEQTRIPELLIRKRAIRTARRTHALLTVGRAVIDRYEAAKARQGLLDFDDLIDKTLALLQRSGAAWVMYKLDAGIDHILVDEAQDTSPEQWDILRSLASDFTAGEGAHRRRRTFFAVGDEKQSIYSFQGAAPRKFDEMHRYFERRIREAAEADARDAELAYVRLPLSFRSVPGVLEAVDRVFSTAENFDGLSFEAGVSSTVHEAWKVGLPGCLEIWNTVQGRETKDPDDWLLPVDQPGKHDPPVILADRIAGAVRAWIARGSPVRVHDGDDRPRRVRAGDVLILVRTRGPIFEAVIRALKKRGVPVAGADRMVLTDHIAVMDLVAAGRAALLRGDDLSLACVLKSPLISLDDDDLLALAPGRGPRAALADAIDADPNYAAVAATLADWRRTAATASPFDFYMRLLGTEGRKRFAARLGPEADDAIDEFLRRALEHERDAAPSLPLFLAAMEAAGALEIKRDMEAVGDSVRVMTVHAAKGLEAKIVVLADTCSLPDGRLDPKLFKLRRENAAEDAAPLLAWSARKADDPPPVAQARDASRAEALQEYRRLLYVALTRAEERLVIAGYEGKPKQDGSSSRPAGCWYDMILGTMSPVLVEAPSPWDGDGPMLVYGKTADGDAASSVTAATAAASALPDWALRPAASERAPAPPIRPSNPLAAADEAAPAQSFAWADPKARIVGRLAHTLLQQLPDVPAERRRAAAARFVAARAAGLPAATADDLVGSILSLIEDARIAPLFAPGSRAEVAVAGTLARSDGSRVQVSGQIDRLAVAPGAVWIADFKTGTRPADGAPRAYVDQLALYRALVAPLYPEMTVRAVLVWTEGPEVLEVEPSRLDAALATILAKRAHKSAGTVLLAE